jgi:hypothetical protein
MASHTAQPNVTTAPLERGHHRTLIIGLAFAGASIVALVLILALSSGGSSSPSKPAVSQARVSGPYPNGGPADGTPSAVAQAVGSVPARGYSLSTNVYAPAVTAGTPASGITPRLSHLGH